MLANSNLELPCLTALMQPQAFNNHDKSESDLVTSNKDAWKLEENAKTC